MILFGEDDKNFKIGEPIRKGVTIIIPNDINILDVRVEQNGKPFKIVPHETKKNSSEGIRSDVDMIRNLDKIRNELLKMYIDKLNSGEYISP